MPTLKGRTVVVGISGGIAAYKACELVRLLKQEAACVHVVMTQHAQEFVTALTLQTLSQNPVATALFDLTQESQIGHIALADKADILAIAPATANIIAKLAHGLCDDLLSTIVCATRAPVIIAPAMNVHMYKNVITQKNIARLKKLGYRFVDPETGELACGYEGPGRLAEPIKIFDAIKKFIKK